MMKQAWALILVLLLLNGCSVYQTSGRKHLQSRAFEFKKAEANLLGCGPKAELNQEWQLLFNDGVQAYGLQETVRFISEDQTQSCDFQFSSLEEQEEVFDSALGLSRLHFSLGQFALTHRLPLKYP